VCIFYIFFMYNLYFYIWIKVKEKSYIFVCISYIFICTIYIFVCTHYIFSCTSYIFICTTSITSQFNLNSIMSCE
ncbi:MAG: hypothetical protein K6253_02500, partial [Candidatus Liberibacter asiaticus]|nr:hypothetical protein [Candidatus Liberibacter asiaticus]